MTTTRKVLKNNLVLNISHVLSKSINFVLILIVTRMLGLAGYGVYTFSFSFVSLFMVLGNLGINSLLTRDVAREKSLINSFLGKSIPLLLTLSGGVIIIINLYVTFSNFPPVVGAAIRIFSVYIFFDNLSRHFISVFRAFEKMEYEAITNLAERLLLLITSFILWQTGQNLLTLLLVFTGVEIFKSGIAFFYMRKFFQKIEWSFFNPDSLIILKQALPFALMSIFGTVSGRIDTVMLQYFHSENAVGLYGVAHKVIESLTFIPENAAMALFPSLSILLIKKKTDINQTLNRTLLYFSIVAMPLAIGLSLISPRIINLLFKPEFTESFVALRWLSIALGVIFFKYFFATILNSTGHQTKFAIAAGLAMIFNVVLNYLLIPKYSILGASAATIASETISVIMAAVFVVRTIKYKIRYIYLLKPAIATGLMGGIVYLTANLHIVLTIVIATISYIFFLLMLRTISLQNLKKELTQLKKAG